MLGVTSKLTHNQFAPLIAVRLASKAICLDCVMEVLLPLQVRFIPWNFFWTDGGVLKAVSYAESFVYPKTDFSQMFGF